MNRSFLPAIAGLFSALLAPSLYAGEPGTYEPAWHSLARHKDPEWLLDARFGIYTHWGPVTEATATAPAEMEWYGRQLYEEKHPAFEYHRQRFGDQKTVGYKDVLPRFKAEKFDAEAWADLLAKAGARFAGPVAVHHDNFAMWDSAATEYNAKRIGPGRDIVGELERAIRARGMKFITTFHHGFAWRYFEPAYAYDAGDGTYSGLYGERHAPGAPPSRAYLDRWLAMVNEVNAKYRPDLLWFDFELGSVIPPEYQQRMFADSYNQAAADGRELGIAHKHWEIHEHTGIIDFERGRMDRSTDFVWLTDSSVGPWFHHRCLPYRSTDEIVDILADIVSKNGVLLLNVAPDADGTIPEGGRKILLEIGDWLRVNGEAIYGARTWRVHGEGPTRTGGGAFSEGGDRPFTAQDVRYTRSKDGGALHAVVLDWPSGPIVLRSVRVTSRAPDAGVSLLGHGKVAWRLDDAGRPVIDVPDLPPDRRPCRFAYAFRLSGLETDLHPEAAFSLPGAVRLEPARATLEGKMIREQVNEGRPNIGFWDDPKERIHWLAWIERPGRWLVRAEVSSAYGESGLRVETDGTSIQAAVPRTDGWFQPVMVGFGELRFEKAGVYHLTLGPSDPAAWKAVNVYAIELAPAPGPGE